MHGITARGIITPVADSKGAAWENQHTIVCEDIRQTMCPYALPYGLIPKDSVSTPGLKPGACRWHPCQPTAEAVEQHAPATIGTLTGAPRTALHRTHSVYRETFASFTQEKRLCSCNPQNALVKEHQPGLSRRRVSLCFRKCTAYFVTYTTELCLRHTRNCPVGATSSYPQG